MEKRLVIAPHLPRPIVQGDLPLHSCVAAVTVEWHQEVATVCYVHYVTMIIV